MTGERIYLRGARVRALRQARNIEPGVLAYKAGISTAHVYRLERGERPHASAVVVGKVARALQTTVEYLIGLTSDPSPLQSSDIELDPECAVQLQDVTQRLARLPARVQKHVVEAMMMMLEAAEVGQAGTFLKE